MKKGKSKKSPFSERPALLDIGLKSNVEIPRNQYPFSIPSIATLESLPLHPKVTYFVGENGSGKSTLLEAIAICLKMNPEGGGRNFNFATRESHSSLSDFLVLGKSGKQITDSYFLRAESYFNVATKIEEMDKEPAAAEPVILSYGGVSLHEQSHGESFFALLQNRLRGNGVYLFDEPEAALSPHRQLAMLGQIHELVKLKSQFIIATHSPIVLAYPDSLIYQFEKSGIREICYEDADCVGVYQSFLRYRETMLQEILKNDV